MKHIALMASLAVALAGLAGCDGGRPAGGSTGPVEPPPGGSSSAPGSGSYRTFVLQTTPPQFGGHRPKSPPDLKQLKRRPQIDVRPPKVLVEPKLRPPHL